MTNFIENESGLMIRTNIEELIKQGKESAKDLQPPSQELLDNIQEVLKTEYKRNRIVEYPAIGDQLDALFHAGVFPAEMAAQIQAVKDKYPKPENINV